MRSVTCSFVVLSAGLGLGLWSCSSKSSNYKLAEETDGQGLVGDMGGTTTASGSGSPAAGNGTGSTVTNASGVNVTSGAATTGGTGSTAAGVGGATNNGTIGGTDGSGGSTSTCADTPPDDRETCATWAEWGECDAEWLADFCHQTCGRCDDSSSDSGSGGVSNNNSNTSNDTTSSTSNSSTTGSLGDDNPWGDVSGGQQGWASRYWDCCKPSCGWQGNASNPVKSCDISDNSLGVTDARNGCEGGGTAYTCHSMAPWAYSSQVSFGYAAINGVSCGQCFHIQFTGTASRGGGQGAQRIANKSMIIMATNIGGIEQGQFDLLIPGGGVGIFNGCSGQWGVTNEELGAQYGGFLTVCSQQGGGDHDAVKSCVRQRCESVFGERNLTDLYNGCLWFVDWFEAADNPDFRYEPVDCPQELVNAAH